MYRIFLIILLFGFQLKSLAQTEPVKKPIPAQIQSQDKAKKVGISSASRRSNLPNPAQKTGPKGGEGMNRPDPGTNRPPQENIPNRSHVRVPKARPVGPITRPGITPRLPKNRPPGS